MKLKSRNSRRLVILVGLAIAVLAIVWPFLDDRLTPEIRHVVLISIDTCRADYLSCYGYPRETTPNIDELAREGILFENVFSPVPLTLPAHSSMFTGTIPPYHGVHDNFENKLAEDNVTLPEILKDAGFTTAAFVGAFVLDSRFGLDQGFDSYNDRFEEEYRGADINERRGDEVSRLAIDWLDQHQKDKFFLFLHYFDAHAAYQPPEPFASQFPTNPYAGEIAYADHCIGLVITRLKELELFDSTLIVIMSDHGEMLGEHGEPNHSYFIYNAAIKVPLIFKLPGSAQARRIIQPASLVDIVPTICELSGIQAPVPLQGIDLSNRILGQENTANDPRYIYCESFKPTTYNANHLLAVVSHDGWKYIQTTRPELYNIQKDPQEKNNLAVRQAARARILQNRLQEIIEQTVRQVSGSRMETDPQALRRLESLGYIAGSITKDFKFDQTKVDPKDLIALHASCTEVLRLIAATEYPEAKAMAEEMIRLHPDLSRGYNYLARIAIERQEFTEALVHLNQILEIDGDTAKTYERLGTVLKLQGNLDEAAAHYRRALEIDSEYADAYYNLGVVLQSQGKLDAAIEHYTNAARINPDLPETQNNLGVLLEFQGNLDEAIICYRRALRARPYHANTHNNLGKALRNQGKLDEAIEHLVEAVRLNPDFAEPHTNLGHTFVRLQRLDEAGEHFKKAHKLNPNFASHYNLARLYHLQGKTDLSVKHAQEVLQEKPDSVEVLNFLAWIKATHPDVRFRHAEEAVQRAQRACELTNYRDPESLHTLAAAYAAAESFSQALETAEKALKLAQEANKENLAEKIQMHLQSYKAGRPWREENRTGL